MELKRKINIIKIIINLLNKSNGRDKIWRVFQYLINLIIYYYFNNNNIKERFIKDFWNNITITRNLLKFGKQIKLHKKSFNILYFFIFIKRLKDKYLFFNFFSKLYLSLFYYAENILLLNKLNIITGDKIIVKKISGIFWFLSLLHQIIKNLIKLYKLSFNNIKCDSNNAINKEKIDKIKIDILRVILDISSSLKLFLPQLDNDVTLILGFFSSIIKIYQII